MFNACFLVLKIYASKFRLWDEFSNLTHLLHRCKHISNNIWTFQWVEIRENKVVGELFWVRIHAAAPLQYLAHRGVCHEHAHQDQGKGEKNFWQVQGIYMFLEYWMNYVLIFYTIYYNLRVLERLRCDIRTSWGASSRGEQAVLTQLVYIRRVRTLFSCVLFHNLSLLPLLEISNGLLHLYVFIFISI